MPSVLPEGLPAPMPLPDGLDKPYYDGVAQNKLVAQRCRSCRRWQWGPEWICHACHSFDIGWESPPGPARIYSWERVWHPIHPALKNAVPYVVLLVEFPEADGIRMIGNLAGDPRAPIEIGAKVAPVFEPHTEGKRPFTLVHWKLA